MARVCECGCGRSMEGRRVSARFVNDAHRVAAHRARKATSTSAEAKASVGVAPAPSPTLDAKLAAGIAQWGVKPEAAVDILRRAREEQPEDLDTWFSGLTQTIPAYFQLRTGGSASTITRTGPVIPTVRYMNPEEFGEHLEDIASGRLK